VRSSRFLKDTAKRVNIRPEDDKDEEEVSNSEDSHHK